MADSGVLDRIIRAQARNALLNSDDLTAAAHALAEQATRTAAEVTAADSTGERLIGEAAVLHPAVVRPADTTSNLNGQTVLLVSGAIVGAVGLSQQAKSLRSLGATHVHAVILDGWDGEVPGCETIEMLATHRSVVDHAAPRHQGVGAAA
jgi:hypothetical protein